jgi:hypothetical protein
MRNQRIIGKQMENLFYTAARTFNIRTVNIHVNNASK